MQNKEYIEDEIDLRELFQTIWNSKKFIVIFTFIITLLAVIYVNIKTPIYEAKAVIEIGSYKVEKIRPADNLAFIEEVPIDDSDQLVKKLSTIFIDLDKDSEITNISVAKGIKNFIEITSASKSNELAKKAINEILVYIQNEHISTLNDSKNKNLSEIKNIDLSILNIKNEKIDNLNKKIELYQQNIINLEEQNNLITQTSKNINTLDPSIAALILMEKRNISNERISTKSTLYDLVERKQSIVNIDINKLLERKKILETLSLPYNNKNSEIVGNILTNDHPTKPKKALVIAVAFVTGFILSIFLVSFMQFVSGMRKEEK